MVTDQFISQMIATLMSVANKSTSVVDTRRSSDASDGSSNLERSSVFSQSINADDLKKLVDETEVNETVVFEAKY